MKKTYINLEGDPFEIEFTEHDISKYDALYHVTLKTRRQAIETEGLRTKMPQHKGLVETDLLFFSYPVDKNSSDFFRWSDEHYSMVALNARKLHEDGYVFYDDWFGRKDASSKRNHLCIDRDIPKEYIMKIFEWPWKQD